MSSFLSSKGVPMFSRRGTLAVVCLATAMLMLDITVVNTALPKIARDLDTGLGGLQWVVDAYTLALAAIVLTAGLDRRPVRPPPALRLRPRRLHAASLCARRPASIEMLDAARAIQGLGAAMMFATSLALLADAFPERAGARRRRSRPTAPRSAPRSRSARSSAAR